MNRFIVLLVAIGIFVNAILPGRLCAAGPETAMEKSDDPLFHFYENEQLELASFEGTVKAVSPIPDPLKNDYDDCLYTVFVEINQILSNAARNAEIPREVVVAIPIMHKKAIIRKNIFRPGDKINCSCADYSQMPEAVQQIQVSNDIQSFDYPWYYALNITRVNDFQGNGNQSFAKRTITVFPVQSLPRDDDAARLRRERIQNEIMRIENELKKHGGSFEAWKKEYAPTAEKYGKLCAARFKGWIGNSYFAADTNETSYRTREYINGILPYKKYLEENNIDLIVVRIPSKGDFAARVLGGDDFQENPAWIEHYYECLKNDIEIVDPMHEMWKHRFDNPLSYFYNDRTELHPYEGALLVASQVTADVLKRYGHDAKGARFVMRDMVPLSDEQRYYWPVGNDLYTGKAKFKAVRTADGEKQVILSQETASDFIFVSNSILGEQEMRQNGASLPHYVAYYLQRNIAWKFQSGVANVMLRNLLTTPHVLDRRKAVVMGAQSNLWKGGFTELPQYLKTDAEVISLEKEFDLFSSEIRIVDNEYNILFKDDSGVNKIRRNNSKKLKFALELPISHEQKSWMLRINFGRIFSHLVIKIYDPGSGNVIDTFEGTVDSDTSADLFIPPTDGLKNVVLEFYIADPGLLTIRNFELWYF